MQHARELADAPSITVEAPDPGQVVSIRRQDAEQVWQALAAALQWFDRVERAIGRDVLESELPNRFQGRLSLHNAATVMVRALDLPSSPEPE
jgi:hypothetical protein